MVYLLAALATQVWGDGIQEIVIITGRSKGQRRTRGLNRRRAQNARTRHVRYRERVAAFALHCQMVLQHQMESEAAAAQQRSAASQLLLAAVDAEDAGDAGGAVIALLHALGYRSRSHDIPNADPPEAVMSCRCGSWGHLHAASTCLPCGEIDPHIDWTQD